MGGSGRSGYRWAWSLPLFATLLLSSCDGGDDDDSADNPAPPATLRDLVYAGTPAGIELVGDLFVPADAAASPVVVLVHGGGFFEGHRSELEPVAVQLQAQGIASFTIDYRLVKQSGGEFPGSTVDVRDAVRFLHAHGEEYGLGGVCGTFGSSAGGTLGALASFTVDDLLMARAGWHGLHGYSDAAPSFVGAYSIYDFTTREEEHGDVPGPERNWLGGEPADLPQRYEYASPISHVDGSDGPALLLQGEADGLVPLSQATSMLAALQAAGVQGELQTYADAVHSFLFPVDDTNPDGLDAVARTVEFFAAQCEEGVPVVTGDQTVVQEGSATWDDVTWTGSESYLLRGAAGETLCQRDYETTGVGVGGMGAVELTYELVDEQGDCLDAPYAPDADATWTYIPGTDTRDGSEAIFRSADGLGDFRWFDLTRAGATLTYSLTQPLPP